MCGFFAASSLRTSSGEAVYVDGTIARTVFDGVFSLQNRRLFAAWLAIRALNWLPCRIIDAQFLPPAHDLSNQHEAGVICATISFAFGG